MEPLIQNPPAHEDEDSFDNILSFQSDNLSCFEERPLTSTGRQRASFIELENNSDEDESDVENPLGGDSDNERNGIPAIFFRVVLHTEEEDEIPQGLPKEMIEKIKRMKMGKSGKDCSVCYNGFKAGERIRKLPCKHIFHDNCIMPWFEENITCPNCRFNLVDFFTENPEGSYN